MEIPQGYFAGKWGTSHNIISLHWKTLSRHFSLSFIASGRSSGLHPVSSHSCCVYVLAGCPAFDRPYVGVHRSTSLMSSSLFLQQCPACCGEIGSGISVLAAWHNDDDIEKYLLSVTVNVVGNRIGDPSANPRRSCLFHFVQTHRFLKGTSLLSPSLTMDG